MAARVKVGWIEPEEADGRREPPAEAEADA